MRSFPSRLNFARREQAACSALNSDGISAISDAVILWNVGAALDQSQRHLGTPATGRKGFTGDTIAVTAGSQILDGTPAVCPMYYSGTRVCPYIRGWREDSARCLFGRPLLHSLFGGFLPGCSLSRTLFRARARRGFFPLLGRGRDGLARLGFFGGGGHPLDRVFGRGFGQGGGAIHHHINDLVRERRSSSALVCVGCGLPGFFVIHESLLWVAPLLLSLVPGSQVCSYICRFEAKIGDSRMAS